MGARDAILSDIRRGLGRGPLAPAEAADLEAQLRQRATPLPAIGRTEGAARTARFIEQARASLAGVEPVADPGSVVEAVRQFLVRRNLPARLRLADHPELRRLPFDPGLLDISFGVPDPEDRVGLSYARAGIAETGTLVLPSGPQSPSTLNFLPEFHLVVLPAGRIVPALEHLWAELRAAGDDRVLPRTLNLVTGPSRSADIEATLELGAHGPRELHILLTDSDPDLAS